MRRDTLATIALGRDSGGIMALETYRKKRDFTVTPEPEGKAGQKAGSSFVIQKHAARRLHYDLRLEMGGVLKSWAVTRGPSMVSGEKRLAVHVEDHPLDYGGFEGAIPKGSYGGGSVLVWDRGSWTPVGDVALAYAKGHLEFDLHGEKLSGRWHLVRMQPKRGEKSEGWLLIKADDTHARSPDAPDILEDRPESILTGRLIEDIAGHGPEKPNQPCRAPPSKTEAARKPKVRDVPAFVPPMLASSVSATPRGDRWLHEIKFDGYRLQARVEKGRVTLLTRSGIDWTDRFGDKVSGALTALQVDSAIFDGEMVVETGPGVSDFSALQADLSEGRKDRFVFYAFDLLFVEGRDLRALPLVDRKTRLHKLLQKAKGPVHHSEHFAESGQLVLRHACRLGLEGIISKAKDSRYQSGRSKSWVKSKCSSRQEFVIGGYAPSTVSDAAIGSLLLGVYEDDKLQYVGRVGTGFSTVMAEALFRKLSAIPADKQPFSERLTATEARQARHVRPELVAEIEFRAWTADGHLRHASFRGLREDKDPRDVRRETRKSGTTALPRPQKRTVTLTHPDRIYWPDAGVTKAGLADYYADVWRHVAPHVVGRPLALLRCPSGIDGQTFFQKNVWKGMNSNIRLLRDPKDRAGPQLIGIDDLDGLMGLVQSAALELHPWGSTNANWELPDRIVMDLDPGEGVGWDQIIAAATEVRERLESAGLAAFVKTSGGKGLHVVAPLQPRADWPAVKSFTKAMAAAMEADNPKRYTASVSKAKRRGKILIDYLRNQRGATAVAAFSTRARPGAPVSIPVSWDEVGQLSGAAVFTVASLPTRLAALTHDPWAEFFIAAVPLPATR